MATSVLQRAGVGGVAVLMTVSGQPAATTMTAAASTLVLLGISG